MSSETVYQLLRYLEALPKLPQWQGVKPRGVLVAPGLKRGVKEMLDARGIGYVRLHYRDLKPDEEPAAKRTKTPSKKSRSRR